MAIKEVFKDEIPLISATKSISGHGLGAAGVSEAIYSLLMLEGDFVFGSANVSIMDKEAEGMPIVCERLDNAGLETVMSNSFGCMGALSSKFNQTPEIASRPFDADRDGFVISGGGGIVVLEELEHAQARDAKIYAEIVGYGATSDGMDMVKPSGEGAARCMQQALSTVDLPVNGT